MCEKNEPAVTAGDYARSVSLSSSMVYASTLLSVCCCNAAHNGERVASCRALGERPQAWQGLGSSKIRVAGLLACVTRSDARGACRGGGAARWQCVESDGWHHFRQVWRNIIRTTSTVTRERSVGAQGGVAGAPEILLTLESSAREKG